MRDASATQQSVGVFPDRNTLAAVNHASAPSSRRHLWSAANVDLLRSDYPTVKLVRDIAAELGRSVGAVYGKAGRLKLKRPRRGRVPADCVASHPVAAVVPDTPPASAAPAPEPAPPAACPVSPGLRRSAAPRPQPLPQLPLGPEPPRAQTVERTKLGGRPGCWTRDDGALSVRLERLFLSGFHTSCIATVLNTTEGAVGTRAWAMNLPRREPGTLRHDVEAARLVDHLAAPLPQSVYSWKNEKMLSRKSCMRKGDPFWGTNGIGFCNDAKRHRAYKDLQASSSMHAW